MILEFKTTWFTISKPRGSQIYTLFIPLAQQLEAHRDDLRQTCENVVRPAGNARDRGQTDYHGTAAQVSQGRDEISVLYKSYQTLFVRHWNSFSTKEPEIDVENDLPPVKRPYDHEKSLKLMDECQNNADFFNPSVMAIDEVQVE